MGLSPYALLAALTVFFIVMGMFLDGISIVVLTVSIILPMVQAAGIDPIWFGIFLVLVVEMSQITPPVGFNLFVLQTITGRDIFTIARYAAPFFGLLVLAVAMLSLFPEIALWLARHDAHETEPRVGPVVSSAHLAASDLPELSEMEFALTMANHAFQRWITRCPTPPARRACRRWRCWSCISSTTATGPRRWPISASC